MAKPLKVRILKSTLNDGTVMYTAQYRMMGTWFSFADDETSVTRKVVAELFHDMLYDDDAPSPRSIWIHADYCATSEDIGECKLLIKAYLDAVDAYNKSIDGKTVKKTEVIRL